MNKLQGIFKIEERGRRNKLKEILTALAFVTLVSPNQFRYIYKWAQSQRMLASPIKDKKPWITYSAIEYLDTIIDKNMKVFEFGSGGSTIYFANNVSKVTSVEHDENWFKEIGGVLKSLSINNVDYRLRPPKNLNDDVKTHEYFRSTAIPNRSFKSYTTEITKFPDQYFDLVVVDGRARVACLRESYKKVKNNGFLVLDNSERKDYAEAFIFMKDRNYEVLNFFGLIAYTTSLMQTTFWRVKH